MENVDAAEEHEGVVEVAADAAEERANVTDVADVPDDAKTILNYPYNI